MDRTEAFVEACEGSVRLYLIINGKSKNTYIYDTHDLVDTRGPFRLLAEDDRELGELLASRRQE